MTTADSLSSSLQMSAIAASLIGVGFAYFNQNQKLQNEKLEAEQRIKEERRRTRRILRNTLEYKERMQRYMKKKREYEATLTDVAYFN